MMQPSYTLRDLGSSLCLKANTKNQEKYLDQEKSCSAVNRSQKPSLLLKGTQLAFSNQFIQQAAWHGVTGKGSSGSTNITSMIHQPREAAQKHTHCRSPLTLFLQHPPSSCSLCRAEAPSPFHTGAF